MATLGIDIGGTNLSLGLVENGKIIQEIHTPSFRPEMTLDETLDYLAAQIEKVFRTGTEKIGIGVPSVVDVKQGIVYDTQNIPSWTVVPLKERLEKRFGVPVAVNNDANCFAMGVYGTYPADAKPESLVVVTLGTGVGMGIVLDGERTGNCFAGPTAAPANWAACPTRTASWKTTAARSSSPAQAGTAGTPRRRPKRGIPTPSFCSTSSVRTWVRSCAP